VCSSSSSIGTSTHRDSGHAALVLAFELVRVSLLCKLALDLDEPVLARRAARHAVTAARELAEMDVPTDAEPLPEVDDLLDRLRPDPPDQEES
jgi:hypothetical protein